jgi:hypothetical protein
MATVLRFTQHTVAWPTLKPSEGENWIKDQVSLSLEDEREDDGSFGEMTWNFATFNDDHHGVQMRVFGDGRKCYQDSRTQRAIATWLALPDSDEITPADFCELLAAVGAVPSKYHARGGR